MRQGTEYTQRLTILFENTTRMWVKTEKSIIRERLREIELLKKENKELEQAINELMVQCDIKYFRFKDKEFYKQEYSLNLSSKKLLDK